MEHSTHARTFEWVAPLVTQLSCERDATALVRRAHTSLARELGAVWNAAIAAGAPPLGDLHVLQDAPAERIETAVPGSETNAAEPVRVSMHDGEVALHIRRIDATRISLLYGVASNEHLDEVGPHVHAVGCFLRARLDDLFAVTEAQGEKAELDRRVAELSLLFKGLDVALSSVELPKVMRAFMTCVTAGEAIGFNRAFLFLLDEARQELRGTLALGPASREDAGRIWESLEHEGGSLEERLRRSLEQATDEPPPPGSLGARVRQMHVPLDASYSVLARAVLRTDASPMRFYRGEAHEPFANEFDSNEFVVVPILGRERTIGVLVADNVYSGEPIRDDRIALLSGLASHVGVIIENVLVFHDVSRRYAELSQVQAVNRALLSSADFVQVLARIAAISASMLKADGSLLFVADGTPLALRLETQHHAGKSTLSEAAVRRCTEVAQTTLHDPSGVGQRVRVEGEDANPLDVLSAPMQIDDAVAGVLVAYRRADVEGARAFDEHSHRFLSIIADQAAIAVLSGRRTQTIQEDQRRIHSLNELLYRYEKLAALGEAASMIAHEIRNPLTALGGFARRMLRSSDLEPSDRDAVRVIVDETARLERILNDQLSFVRSARLERGARSLNALVRECATLLRQQLDERDVLLQLDLQAQLPDVALDADRMKQVVVNLVMNAIDAVGGAGRVRISTRQCDTYVELDVANTGPPIPRERQATLFEPFSTSRQIGTGLGLAVVHQIVAEHEGRIEVLSEDEWGTVFRIRLAIA